MIYSLFSNTTKIKQAFYCLLVSGSSLAFLASSTVSAEPKIIDETVKKALVATPDLKNGKKLYHNCALCHTPEGWGSPLGSFPQIAGQHKTVILKQLADIHKGNRDNPTMMPFTPNLFKKGSQALADISSYIEQLPMVPNNSIGMGLQLEEGKRLYNANCKSCHGDNGEGKSEEFYPRIHGQHYQYLLRQLQWIKTGKRRNADTKMTKQLKAFSYQELNIIADYVSRLRPDKMLLADHADWRNPDFRSGFKSNSRPEPTTGAIK